MRDAMEAITEQRKALGLRIKAARDAKAWKQKELAAAVHVEPVTVSRWERGQHAPDLDTLAEIAQATAQPLSFFVDGPVSADAGERLASLEQELEEVRRSLADVAEIKVTLARIEALIRGREERPRSSPASV